MNDDSPFDALSEIEPKERLSPDEQARVDSMTRMMESYLASIRPQVQSLAEFKPPKLEYCWLQGHPRDKRFQEAFLARMGEGWCCGHVSHRFDYPDGSVVLLLHREVKEDAAK